MKRMPYTALALLLLVACDSPGAADAGMTDGGAAIDAGPALDSGPGEDAGLDDAGTLDAGSADDAGTPGDAGPGCGADTVADSPDEAEDVGAIADNTDYPAGSESVVIGSRSDIDWYTYTVSDGSFGNVEPRVGLSELPGGARYELCLYFQCDSDLLSVGCEGTAVAHELSADRHGCCITGTGTELEVKLSPIRCSGSDESGRVFARVSQQTGDALCTPYDLAWGDD